MTNRCEKCNSITHISKPKDLNKGQVMFIVVLTTIGASFLLKALSLIP